jgi:hypothetical protein
VRGAARKGGSYREHVCPLVDHQSGRSGNADERWQHKPTLKGTARIWFFVEDRTVYLEQVHTSHPNETK